MKYLIYILFLIFPFAALTAQKSLLQSGPMLGYSEMREVMLWIQTKENADVFAEYWVKGNSTKKFRTKTYSTYPETVYTAHLKADSVLPDNKYEYAIYINKQMIEFDYPLEFQSQSLWQYRKDPPDFTFATGSCFYNNDEPYDRPGRGYGASNSIFTEINKLRPDFMLWLGDNVYLREADWFTQEGINYRYTQQRSAKELQALLASSHNYAIWDDHDYGPNDADRGFREKEKTLEAFKTFWANPSYGINGKAGITSMFTWADVDFFLLDNRYYRSPSSRKTDANKQILGDEQIEWLLDNLSSSKASFKIIVIGGQVLNPLPEFENYSNYSAEQERLLNAITKEGINGVIFLSGDRHFTELSKMDRQNSYSLLDLTVSPLTSGAFQDACTKENNPLRVDGTCITTQNFAMIEVSGKRKERMIKFKIYDWQGAFKWEKVYSIKELSHKK